MLHRVLAVHGGHAERAQLAREVARPLDGDERIVRAVLHEHRRRVVGVEIERGGVEHRTHRERGLRARPFTALQRDAEREPGPLREAADDRLAAIETERVGLLGEEVVERGERLRVRALRLLAGEHAVPRIAGRSGHGILAARQHRGERAVGIEVGEQAAEVTLVGAVAVHEQRQPVRVRTLDDIRDERHAGRLHVAANVTIRSGRRSGSTRG